MRAAASRTFCTAGNKSPTRTAIMAITTNNSIKVNPDRLFRCFTSISKNEKIMSRNEQGQGCGFSGFGRHASPTAWDRTLSKCYLLRIDESPLSRAQNGNENRNLLGAGYREHQEWNDKTSVRKLIVFHEVAACFRPKSGGNRRPARLPLLMGELLRSNHFLSQNARIF
jgi:hypothetical protein